MKNLFILSIVMFVFVGCKNGRSNPENSNHSHDEILNEKKEASPKKVLSPHTETMVTIGDAHIHIDYSSPGVRDRIIFGGLLPFDQVWQSGAHMATWIETNKDLSIYGKTLKAGKYGFFTIPSKGEWTVIFNKNWNQHGKDDYDEKDDVLRFKVIPELSEKITEHLLYEISKIEENKGRISLSWEKVTINFPFNVIKN